MRLSLILLFLFTCSVLSMGQKPTYYLNPDKKLVQYNYERWDTDKGLPSNSLLYVHQSKQGYIWLSGYSGLIRYNGRQFKTYNNLNVDVFNTNVIRNITEDAEGTLWMTTQGNALLSFKNGSFEAHGQAEGLWQLYRGLLIDNENRIWAASPEKGWFYYQNGQFNFIEYTSPLNNIEVRAIAQSKTGAIWFGTMGEGLFLYENGKMVNFTTDNGLLSNWVYSFFVDENDKLWIGTNKGVCTYNGHRFVQVHNEINTVVNAIITDRFGSFWFGTYNGLFRYIPFKQQLENVTSSNGLANNFIVDLQFDMEGSLWVTHYKGGLTRIKDGKFINYTQNGGLPGKVVNSVFETSNGGLLAGFDNGTLVIIDKGEIKTLPLNSKHGNTRIRHVMVDNRQNMWISTYNGLLKVDENLNEKWFKADNEFFDNQFRLTFQDSKGNIWVGSRNNGVAVLNNNNKVLAHYNVENGLLSNLVMAIEEDQDGNIWVGTSEGNGCLNKIDPNGKISSFTNAQGFDGEIVFNIYPEINGNVWLATVDGLWLYNGSAFTKFSTKNGLLNNTVYDILADDVGFFWLPFENGVMKVRKDDLLAMINSPNRRFECRLYNQYDGMTNAECNSTAQALKMKNGTLVFPTLDGLSIIDPQDEIINNFIPPVVIDEFIVDQKQYGVNSSDLVFDPDKTRYTFGFAGLSLYEPDKVLYKYKLSGFDKDWVETAVPIVSYTNLPHGKYVFTVLASNNDGVWNQKGTSLSFVVKPKFTETGTFYIILLIVSFLALFALYMLFVDGLRRNQIRLEKQVAIRNREVIDKNEALELLMGEVKKQNETLQWQKNEIEKQTAELQRQKEELDNNNQSKEKIISVISHDLRSPLGNIQNMLTLLIEKKEQFDEAKKERILASLLDISKSTFYLLDNLLHWSRSQRGHLIYEPQMFLVEPLLSDVKKMLSYQCHKKSITLKIEIDQSELVFGDMNMIKTIFRNILENAIKFTNEGGQVTVSSEHKQNFITYAIRDNGVGMTYDQISRIVNNKEPASTYGTHREKGSGLGLL
ncbi:MAG TPA: two-component regulator propeller domain-containing protein, partial [Prolixibacteraceae bacterium]|nr:two-component regulator propeller domain-containing protein [Prolixibacteraceae bacterium]